MPPTYNVYKGNSSGGPVDYSTLVANVSGLTWTGTALGDSTQTNFAVRATEGGLEEQNTDATVLISLGASGQDLSGLPQAPIALRVVATAGGTALVEWSYPYVGGSGLPPTGFHVYVSPSPTLYYGVAYATVSAVGRGTSYHVTIPSLSNATTYVVGVRSYNAHGEEANTVTVAVTGDTVPPTSVANLTATLVAG